MPRYYDAFIPMERKDEGTEPTIAMETKGEVAGLPMSEVANAESGHGSMMRESSSEHDKAVKSDEPPPAYTPAG